MPGQPATTRADRGPDAQHRDGPACITAARPYVPVVRSPAASCRRLGTTCTGEGAIMPLNAALSASLPRGAAVLALPLGSPRLVLRRFAMTDTDAFAAYRADPLVARYQDWERSSLTEAATFIRRQRRQVPGVPGRWTQIALALRASAAL